MFAKKIRLDDPALTVKPMDAGTGIPVVAKRERLATE
jgi:hypothetical protein